MRLDAWPLSCWVVLMSSEVSPLGWWIINPSTTIANIHSEVVSENIVRLRVFIVEYGVNVASLKPANRNIYFKLPSVKGKHNIIEKIWRSHPLVVVLYSAPKCAKCFTSYNSQVAKLTSLWIFDCIFSYFAAFKWYFINLCFSCSHLWNCD